MEVFNGDDIKNQWMKCWVSGMSCLVLRLNLERLGRLEFRGTDLRMTRIWIASVSRVWLQAIDSEYDCDYH